MTALIVIAAIALLIFLLLASSIRVDMEYERVFKYRVKYLFFTIIGDPESQKRKKKKLGENEKKNTQLKEADRKKQIKSKQVKADKQEQEKSKLKFSLDLIKRIIGRASPHVKRIFKKIRLSNVVVDITAGGDDAAKAAISYGVHCSAVYGLAAFLDNAISFNAESISIRADFDLPETRYCVKGTIKLRLSTLLHSGIWGFFAVLSELRRDSGAPPEKNEPTTKKAA